MEMIDMSDIGPLIKQLRSEKGWSRKELADKLWVSSQDVFDWEHGKDMSFVDAAATLRALGARLIIKLPDEVKSCDNCFHSDTCVWRSTGIETDGDCPYWKERLDGDEET